MLDDRKDGYGTKMKDAELIGIPINIIIGKQYLQNNEIELKHREENREKIREKQREYDKKYREGNREKIAEYARKYREENREYTNKCKRGYNKKKKAICVEYLGGKCVKCGSTERLEFDHIDRTTKKYNITRKVDKTFDNLKEELNKPTEN